MSERVVVAFASGSEELGAKLAESFGALFPDFPLYVVSEFPTPRGRWIPYHVKRGFRENLALVRSTLRGKTIHMACVLLEPGMPYRRLRLMPFLLTPRVLIYNTTLDHFLLRPRCAGQIARHVYWRTREVVTREGNPGGRVYTFFWRLGHPSHFRRPLFYQLSKPAGWVARLGKAVLPARPDPPPGAVLPEGITVVVPSRDGKELLGRLLPGLLRELAGLAAEVIVVDNGSTDGSREWLARQPVAVEHSAEPLPFAAAVNRGILRARYRYTCLLNNDMVLESGFFGPLLRAFRENPDLFCATAQIFFPPGVRREETGKAVMPPREPDSRSTDFPVLCATPVEGENGSYVLYGSGGCSLYDTDKLRRISGFGEMFRPAYVEDLDVGYRGWLRGWPTVYVAQSRVVHHHRSTTKRFYTQEALDLVIDVNFFRFLCRSVAAPRLFHQLWRENTWRVNLMAAQHFPVFRAIAALSFACRAPRWMERPPAGAFDEELILGLGSGDVAVFPGQERRGKPIVIIATPYLPFPLSHGGAVRMYNLMRRAAADYDQVLVTFVDELQPVPPELLALCVEVVQVRRVGTHLRHATERPDVVEEFASPAFRGVLQMMVRKWQPFAVQLEFTQLAQYAADCAPAKTLLVEHDITMDLFEQLLRQGEEWETRRQYERWVRFETDAWRRVDVVVTMSEKDRAAVTGGRAVTLANGVDLERFRPGPAEPEPGRILFIGAFQHLPNLLALEFFLNEVWPKLGSFCPLLHVIAGKRAEYHYEQQKHRVLLDLAQPGLVVDGFVSDVRPAYERAAVVIAPLLASAGTNIKVMEAMAMGKAIVSTPAGINGLDLEDGRDVLVAGTAPAMAEAIVRLFQVPARRRDLERNARATVERLYDWDVIAERQRKLYEEVRRIEE